MPRGAKAKDKDKNHGEGKDNKSNKCQSNKEDLNDNSKIQVNSVGKSDDIIEITVEGQCMEFQSENDSKSEEEGKINFSDKDIRNEN